MKTKTMLIYNHSKFCVFVLYIKYLFYICKRILNNLFVII